MDGHHHVPFTDPATGDESRLERRGSPVPAGVSTPGSGVPTQFSRDGRTGDLSPQAKGRVERMAETFQDRLNRTAAGRGEQYRGSQQRAGDGSTGVSVFHRNTLSLHSGPWTRSCVWNRSCSKHRPPAVCCPARKQGIPLNHFGGGHLCWPRRLPLARTGRGIHCDVATARRPTATPGWYRAVLLRPSGPTFLRH